MYPSDLNESDLPSNIVSNPVTTKGTIPNEPIVQPIKRNSQKVPVALSQQTKQDSPLSKSKLDEGSQQKITEYKQIEYTKQPILLPDSTSFSPNSIENSRPGTLFANTGTAQNLSPAMIQTQSSGSNIAVNLLTHGQKGKKVKKNLGQRNVNNTNILEITGDNLDSPSSKTGTLMQAINPNSFQSPLSILSDGDQLKRQHPPFILEINSNSGIILDNRPNTCGKQIRRRTNAFSFSSVSVNKLKQAGSQNVRNILSGQTRVTSSDASGYQYSHTHGRGFSHLLRNTGVSHNKSVLLPSSSHNITSIGDRNSTPSKISRKAQPVDEQLIVVSPHVKLNRKGVPGVKDLPGSEDQVQRILQQQNNRLPHNLYQKIVQQAQFLETHQDDLYEDQEPMQSLLKVSQAKLVNRKKRLDQSQDLDDDPDDQNFIKLCDAQIGNSQKPSVDKGNMQVLELEKRAVISKSPKNKQPSPPKRNNFQRGSKETESSLYIMGRSSSMPIPEQSQKRSRPLTSGANIPKKDIHRQQLSSPLIFSEDEGDIGGSKESSLIKSPKIFEKQPHKRNHEGLGNAPSTGIGANTTNSTRYHSQERTGHIRMKSQIDPSQLGKITQNLDYDLESMKDLHENYPLESPLSPRDPENQIIPSNEVVNAQRQRLKDQLRESRAKEEQQNEIKEDLQLIRAQLVQQKTRLCTFDQDEGLGKVKQRKSKRPVSQQFQVGGSQKRRVGTSFYEQRQNKKGTHKMHSNEMYNNPVLKLIDYERLREEKYQQVLENGYNKDCSRLLGQYKVRSRDSVRSSYHSSKLSTSSGFYNGIPVSHAKSKELIITKDSNLEESKINACLVQDVLEANQNSLYTVNTHPTEPINTRFRYDPIPPHTAASKAAEDTIKMVLNTHYAQQNMNQSMDNMQPRNSMLRSHTASNRCRFKQMRHLQQRYQSNEYLYMSKKQFEDQMRDKVLNQTTSKKWPLKQDIQNSFQRSQEEAHTVRTHLKSVGSRESHFPTNRDIDTIASQYSNPTNFRHRLTQERINSLNKRADLEEKYIPDKSISPLKKKGNFYNVGILEKDLNMLNLVLNK